MTSPFTREQLLARRCAPVVGEPATDAAAVTAQLTCLPGWSVNDASIERCFRFEDFHDTIAFVNALAWVAHREDHHPHLEIGYDRCTVRWSTHSVGGISVNDFICAAKTDALHDR